MPNSNVAVTEGSGKNIDTRTTASDGDHRQVVVLGDPSVDANVVNVVTADPGASSTTPGVVMRLAGSASVQIVGSSGSLAVYFDRANPSVSIGGQAATLNVALDPGHTLGNIAAVGSVTNTVAVYFDRGNPSVNPSVAYNSGVVGATTQRVVHAVDVAGSVNIVAQGLAFLNVAHTAGIFTVSGSAAGVGISGNTIIAPSANYNFKIFAFQLSSTAQTNLLAKFTSGAASGPTEFWRMPLWAPTQGVMGGNLAVTPPGYLWATGTNVTLALLLDSASLVHYSVSYIKETA